MPNLDSDTAFLDPNISFLENPRIKSAFLKDTVVILTKDYSKLDPPSLEFFTKGAVANIRYSGLSTYGYNQERNDYTDLGNENEWCYIEVVAATFEKCGGHVMAKDLRTLTKKDLGL